MIRRFIGRNPCRPWTFHGSRRHGSAESYPPHESARASSSTSFPSAEAPSAAPAYMFQRGNVPIEDITVGELLGRAAERWPDRHCLISVGENARVTFKDVIRRADKLAAGLTQLGMKRGDRLGVWGPNDVGWFVAAMSAFRAGFVMVAINPAYRADELVYCLQNVAVKAVVSPGSFKTQNYPEMLLNAKQACPGLEHIIISSRDHVTGTRRLADVEALATDLEVERIAAEQSLISCHDGCNVQFTSGTTGKPKAAFLSHRSMVNNSRQAAERSEITADRKICLNVPFFHAFGLLLGQLTALHTGSALVWAAPTFDPVKSVEAMLREKCDVAYGTPTMWINLLDAWRRLDAPTLKLFCGVTGGAPASPDLFQRISELFRFDNVKTIYGLTENTGIAFQSLPGERKELRDTTVGHLSDHVEAMVVDESGSPVSFGTPGELWIRGYCTMLGYWNDPANTGKTITEDGWLKTGDQFVLRADGYGQIVGRIKDMLIRGGENIFPKEIEDFLMTHPSILEAQVVGAFDPVYGEQVCACVRLKDGTRLTADDLRRYCKGKIAHFKIPHYVEFVDEYPKSASGKVKKIQLRQDLEARGVIPTRPN